MGSIVNNQPVSELTALERIGPKGYLRYIFPFQLEKEYGLDETIRVLQAGYQALTQRIPEVACEAVPDGNSKQRGVMRLQKQANGDVACIVVKDLQLKDKSFPVASFDADTFCPRSVWPSAGD
ncbi:hypothetical protein N7471_000010 [Penicillium samsonianum]|uniref:uncharacterized protein n=1 Tax=Penicillium samsonianum TaxID=1882272 RepID=UPI002546D9BE|nr:uncharacterized protein N7471_000010 [Penicillium samsonianum]KAJ6148811.1 hypothetical protein N7471_000010 [Penicillium samsonianum]